MAKLNVAVLYGSRSPEHEVAIITALQVMHNLDKTKYEIIPIYITKTGAWLRGDDSFLLPESYKDLDKLVSKSRSLSLQPANPEIFKVSQLAIRNSPLAIDVVFPIFHGSYGEDGTIQGLLEILNLPYVGCGVLASALGMDKVAQKQIYADSGLSQVDYVWFHRTTWQANHLKVLKQLKSLKLPMYVKPINGGSSIGITKVKTERELIDAIDVAAAYDRKILVEQSAEGFKEINISVLGNSGSPLRTSVCEQPVASGEVLSFSDKYESQSGSPAGASAKAGMASAQRLIPAPIKPATAKKIAAMAKTAYQALDCSGLARVDFLVSPDEKKILINEINTIPGSLAFYLWEASGLKFPALLDELISLALARHADRQKSTSTFPNNLLSSLGQTLSGVKGTKNR